MIYSFTLKLYQLTLKMLQPLNLLNLIVLLAQLHSNSYQTNSLSLQLIIQLILNHLIISQLTLNPINPLLITQPTPETLSLVAYQFNSVALQSTLLKSQELTSNINDL